MRILIADDEDLARISLVSMIQEMAHPFEICGEADNEQELIRLLQEREPDIVLLDYLMPTHNGLEMMKIGKELSPSTKWIILSGFSDYDSAHESVKFGASDYLLKPPSAQELEAALLHAGNSVKEKCVRSHKQFEHTLVSMFSGIMDPSMEDEQAFVHQAEFWGIQLFVDSFLDEPERSALQNSLMEQLQKEIELAQSDSFYTTLFKLPDGETALVGAWNRDKHEVGQRVMSELIGALEELLTQGQHHQIAVTLISTNRCPSIKRLQDEFAVVSHFGALRVTRGVQRHWTLEQLDPHESEWLLSLGQMLVEISHTYLDKNYMSYMNNVDQLQSHLIRQGLNNIPNPTMQAIAQFIRSAMRCHIDPCDPQWTEQLYKHGETLLPHHGLRDSGERMVERAMQQLEQNYADNIKLNEVAKQMRTSSHYLNARFQQVTDLTFVKYLARLRITKAKPLFADPSLKVKQIAEEVGFVSASYFSKCFSEFEGCSPTEYRKKLNNLASNS